MYNNNYGGRYGPNYNYRPDINAYSQRLNTLEQQYYQPQPQAQPIQTMAQTQPQATCYFVTSPDELNRINVQPDTAYIGISTTAKELYVRRMNNNGVIEFETYALASGIQEKDNYKLILEQLTAINEKLSAKEKKDESNVNTNGKTNVRSNDGRAF